MHAKTDSDVTSISATSPPRAAYFVQSPRDSHEGEKIPAHPTVAYSPSASPPHSHTRHSSSTTRFSASRKPSSEDAASYAFPKAPASSRWNGFSPIEEEGLLDEEFSRSDSHIPRRCYFLAFVLGFVALFSLFSLILWGVSRSQKPQISVKSITFHSVVIQAGTDATGVPTDMLTLNSTVKLTFRNRATFFGLHFTSTPLDLSFSQLSVANGYIKKFYQSRKSQRTLQSIVMGNKVPVYGSSASWMGSTKSSANVPLKLSFKVRSRGYVLGRLVKSKFYTNVECSFKMNPNRLNKPISLNGSCFYTGS